MKLHIIYLMKFSVAQTTQCQMTGWLRNTELDRTWKKAVMA